ncbi:MAG: hypothetical protein AVDCRST_MAG34-969 [uncultured Nocardioidaceae bacterium]|uniref:Sulfotransferase family protein n=1 Tax=uncultured Nocardioidaceae bacterium TaxID=253824 RepID=A0A6J4LTF5_9ACTN|nr:MAG: hypothetical protein AVDCRST_MAG34-969 [uncultured Nocardioidaceae bacterium]
MSTVYVHIGLAKTGTTSLQQAAHERRDECAAAGLHVPGTRHRDHRLAAYDLLGRRIEGDDADVVPGAFRRLVDDIAAAGAEKALFSEELLAVARPAQVRRLVRALAPHRVEVIVGLRDLGRTLVSAWQQEVVMGETVSWPEYAAAVRDAGATGSRAGVAFWLRQDVFRVLDAWRRHVPAERIHLVTVPPPGADDRVLLERFADALGIPPATLSLDAGPRNRSLGAVEIEALRRLNGRIATKLSTRQYLYLVEHGIRERLEAPATRPLRLPAEHHPWVAERSEGIVAGLRERGHVVHGDLADLLPPDPGAAVDRPVDDVSDDELVDVLEDMLTALAMAHGALFRRYRRLAERSGEHPGTLEVVRSQARAAVFGSKTAALRWADRSPVAAWGARQYLRRTTKGRPLP